MSLAAVFFSPQGPWRYKNRRESAPNCALLTRSEETDLYTQWWFREGATTKARLASFSEISLFGKLGCSPKNRVRAWNMRMLSIPYRYTVGRVGGRLKSSSLYRRHSVTGGGRLRLVNCRVHGHDYRFVVRFRWHARRAGALARSVSGQLSRCGNRDFARRTGSRV